MPHFQKGFIGQTLMVLLLVAGIGLGTYLVGQRTNLLPKAAENTVYDSKTAVILLKFQNSITPTLTKEDLNGIMFTNPDSVNNYFKYNSFGKVSVTGDVFDWVTLPINVSESSKCEADNWISKANEISSGKGINLNNYKNFVYVWPDSIKDCGVSFVSGNKLAINSESWVKNEHVILHEFGHLISPRVNDPGLVGVNHASFYRCTNGSVTPPCNKEEYGDRYSRMGAPNLFNLHGLHKLALGWLPGSVVQEISKIGVYKINVLSGPDNGIQLLKIKKPDSDLYYYLEYRKDIKYGTQTDLYPISLDLITNGVVIRLWNENPKDQTLLIDTTPDTPTPEDNHKGTNPDEALSDGSFFNDEQNYIKITQVSHDKNSATVEVNLSGTRLTEATTAATTSAAVTPQANTPVQELANGAYSSCGKDVNDLDIPCYKIGVFDEATIISTRGNASIAVKNYETYSKVIEEIGSYIGDLKLKVEAANAAGLAKAQACMNQ